MDEAEDGATRVEQRAGAQHPRPALTRPVHVADRPTPRLRRAQDLLDLVLSALGIATVWAFGLWASATTQGVTQDVRNFGVVRDVMLLPVTVIEGLVILVAPVTVIIGIALRRRFTDLLVTLLGALASALVGWGLLMVAEHLPRAATAPLRVTTGIILDPNGNQVTHTAVALNLVVVTLAALLTCAGEATSMRSIRWSWTGLWIITLLWVVRASMTLPAALVSLLIGRALGCAVRWGVGFRDQRGGAEEIVRALLGLGILPSRIVRTDLDTEETPLPAWALTVDEEGHVMRAGLRLAPVSLSLAHAPTRDGHRHYDAWDEDGRPLTLTLLDPGRDIAVTLRDVWNNLRLRGISRWIAPSLKATAERSTLTALTALGAGVRLPEPLGLARAGTSILMVSRAMPPTRRLVDLPAEEVTDALVDEVWAQLLAAHGKGVAHRNLTPDTVRVGEDGDVWILDWDQGEVATTDLNRHIDLAQMLALLATTIGVERALAALARATDPRTLAAVAPVLQPPVMPTPLAARLREARKDQGDLLQALRGGIVAEGDEAEAPLLDLRRFSPRTLVSVALLFFALVTVLGSLNFTEIRATVSGADPVWIGVAFALACLTWLGGGITLVAFTPARLRLRDAVLTQVAASLVTVVAPAGVGPAALNLRYLARQRVSTALAVTTVTLQQITQFLAMVLVLLLIVFFSDDSLSVTVPYSTIGAVVGVLVGIVALVLAVPPLRRLVWTKLGPTLTQVWPRVMWVVAQPRRIAAIVLGNVVMNLGFIGAFWASLRSMGGSLGLKTLSVTYLASNSLGSVIPSPGGIGPVEATLTGGLQVAGVPLSIALAAAIMYRLVTFYGRIPFGWVAMKVMERRGLL